jgi:plastocyanin
MYVMGEATEKKSSGYGKRPLWQWIVVYLIIGLVVYGLIYYMVLAKKPGSTYTQPQPSAATQQQAVITLTQSGWSPATLTIKAGQTVIWNNKSGQEATVNSDPHPTHTDYPPLNLNSFQDGGTLSLTFPTAGTHGYHNHLNPSEKGTIIVQ